MNAPTSLEAPYRLDEVRFAVPAMSCAGCMAKVERGLLNVPGVHSARVNLTSKQVSVSCDGTVVGDQLIDAIKASGFDASPVNLSVTEAADKEALRELIRALAVAGFAAMNVMLLSVSVWSGAAGATREFFHWVSAGIAVPAILYSGRPFFRSAVAALRTWQTNMDVPIAIGVSLATAMSLYETAFGGGHVWFEGALMLLFFLLVGRVLDRVMQRRAQDGVAALVKQSPSGALVISDDGASHWCETEGLKPGMQMQVAAGERLAADGFVLTGNSAVDQSLLTGESAPQAIERNSEVYAGTLNLDGPLVVQVTEVAGRSALAEITQLMEVASQSKSRYVRIADRAARLYAPVVHTLALASFVGWLLAGAGWHQSLLIGISVLIITCPCALGLAVPVAHVVAAGRLMSHGLLIKQDSALERLARVDRVIFDKTGTLTLGRPTVQNIDVLSPEQKSIVLSLARVSRHPLSSALREALEREDVKSAAITEVREIPGRGVSGLWSGCKVALGKPGHDQDQLAVELLIDEQAQVRLVFAEQLRPDVTESVAGLSSLGLESAILSGDGEVPVSKLAEQLGISARANATPADKFSVLQHANDVGQRVLMVGDGMNDGPALNAAYASMAPGSASDVGQIAADVVFLGNSLAPIPLAVRVARATMKIVRQNFALAIGYNLLAIPLAIAGLVTPLVAAIAMSLSSVVVVANSLRLRNAS